MDELATVTLPPAGPAAGSAQFPLTDLQEGYLVGSSRLIELGGFRPNYYVELDVVGLVPERAEEALNQLIRRHEHLRTVTLAEGGQRVLAGSEMTRVELPVVDLVGLGPEHQEAAIARTRHRMRDDGVDPTHWPMFEIVVHRVRPHRARVHLAMSLLLLDGRSIRQLIREWRLLYDNPAAVLPVAPLTFRECRLAQVAEEDTDAYREHWAYWRARLDTLPDAPRLPLARQPETLDNVQFTRRVCYLTREQWQRFCANARKHRLLPSAALLHLFAQTLGAWAASPHFCLNVLHQGWASQRPQTTGVVGQLGATLAVEVDLGRGDDFWQRAQQVQGQLWKDLAHGDVSAVRVMREVAARRGWTPRAALPYVYTSMLGPAGPVDAPEPAEPAGPPACRMLDSSLRTPQVLVDNQVQDTPGGGIGCVWDIVDDAFPPGLPDAMVDAYQAMLDLISGPDGADASPDPVPAAHRGLIAAINATAMPVPPGRLEDGFVRQVKSRANADAVVTSGRTLTYRELELASRKVAHWLLDRGVGHGSVVPVVMVKGWEQVVAVLGALRAGAAYCPVDAGSPPERIRHLLDQCDAQAVLGQSGHPDPTGGSVPVLHVDQLSTVDSEPAGLPPVSGGQADIAYVIYTSGSTGTPKGVVIDHRGALNTIVDINRRIRLGARDRVFGISSLSFDLSVWDIFGTLAAGATLVLPDAQPWPDPEGWTVAAGRQGVTVWNSVPALAEMLVEVGEQRPDLAWPPIRVFLLSGDWIPLALPERMRRLRGDVRIIAMGGATEASIWSNSYEVDQVHPDWRSVPYGRPLLNQTMRVLDHRLDVRPPWAAGRIHIGGIGIAHGYWRDQTRTAERFIRHPSTDERLYWTGDLGRYWPDGTIEFLGREDRQVKIQGFRVEPGEVEAAIRSHPAVRECVVSAEEAPGGQRRLVALAVPHDGHRPDREAITAHLRSRLPHYMVPGQIHLVQRLPLTPNGKVDVARALATLAEPTTAAAGPARTEQGPFVRRLAALWAHLLQVPTVDPDADFFALGGNSLLALRLVNRVRTDLGLDLPFRLVFEAPTVRGLADHLEHGDGDSSTCAVTLATGTGTELFLFHPVGGAVSSYVSLARSWPGPVTAFESGGLTGGAAAADPDLETMAARYRAELQRRAPDGPYLLGGWSMGGVLAYEVGRQLAERGQPAHVFMLDSDVHNIRQPDTDLARNLEFLGDLAGGRLPAAVTRTLRSAAPDIPAALARDVAVQHRLLPAEIDAAGYARLLRVHAHNLAVLAGYRPARTDLPLLLILAGSVDRPDPVPAWRAACPSIEVDTWPCDHYSIVAGDRTQAITERVTAWLASTGRPVFQDGSHREDGIS